MASQSANEKMTLKKSVGAPLLKPSLDEGPADLAFPWSPIVPAASAAPKLPPDVPPPLLMERDYPEVQGPSHILERIVIAQDGSLALESEGEHFTVGSGKG